MKSPAKPLWLSRSMIVVIGLTALIPFLLAWYYANHPELVEKTSNYGALILPVRQVGYDQLLEHPISSAEKLEAIKGRWILLQVASGACGNECVETLHKTHQGWLMLNKEMPRVQRLLLEAPNEQAAETPGVSQDDALLQAGLSPSVIQALTSAIGKAPGDGVVILLDPLGNLVLWYDTGFDPYKMVKDLKHLLKASQIG